jgi:hypothetical protein
MYLTWTWQDDWKRHERGHVPSAELWFCQMPSLDPNIPSEKCATVEYDRDEFKNHLQEDHKLTSRSQPQLENMILESKIAYSHQYTNAHYKVNFWCGFCNEVIQADHDPHKLAASVGSGSGKRNEDHDPSNHRWDHLDAHFIKEKKTIYDLEGNKMTDWTDWTDLEKKKPRDLKKADFFWRADVYGKENPRKKTKEKKAQGRPHHTVREHSKGFTSIAGEKRKADGDIDRVGRKFRGRNMVTTIYWHCVGDCKVHKTSQS